MTGWPSDGEQPVIGFIGLGRTGAPIALSLRRAGFDVVVFDARAEAVEPLVTAGAIAAESLPNTAAQCDVLVTALPGPSQVEAAMTGRGGAFQALRHGSVWIDMSTSSPALGRTLAMEGEARGVAVVDAPAPGIRPQADTGSLRVFAGGDAADVERVRPVLEAVDAAARVVHVGPRGTGYALRLCLDLLGSVRAAASAEALALAATAGVDPSILRDVLGDGPAVEGGAHDRDLDRDLDRGAGLDAETRDLALAVDLGRDLGVPLELAALVEQLLRRPRAG